MRRTEATPKKRQNYVSKDSGAKDLSPINLFARAFLYTSLSPQRINHLIYLPKTLSPNLNYSIGGDVIPGKPGL